MEAAGRTVRTALVGYGLGGSVFHAPFIEAEPRIVLSVVVTSDPERQSAARARYPLARVVGSFAGLVEIIDEVDLVVVSTPNATHVALADAALRHARHVVVDKPVAPTAAEVRQLAGLAAEVGRMLVPFQNRRWDGDYRTATGLVRSGELGELHRFESRFERWEPAVRTASARSWKRDPGPGQANGILYDLGTHLIDQSVALFGRPRSVYAEIDVRRPRAEVDDDVFLALHYGRGLVCHLWASTVAADRGPRLRLLGSSGSFVKYGMDVQEAALVAGGSPSNPGWGREPPESWGTVTTSAGSRAEATLPGAYQLFYSGLAACLLDGAPPPVDAADAVLTAEVVEAAQRSAAGSEVSLLSDESSTRH